MREYGIPAVAEIPASASLADVVFRRAEAEPGWSCCASGPAPAAGRT